MALTAHRTRKAQPVAALRQTRQVAGDHLALRLRRVGHAGGGEKDRDAAVDIARDHDADLGAAGDDLRRRRAGRLQRSDRRR